MDSRRYVFFVEQSHQPVAQLLLSPPLPSLTLSDGKLILEPVPAGSTVVAGGVSQNAGPAKSMNSETAGPGSADAETSQPGSEPVVAEPAVEPKKRAAQAGRRGKSRSGERPPVEPAVTVAEVPAPALRDRLLLTREEAAALAGIGLNKIDEWSREPGFPVIREGNHFVRIVRALFEEWLIQYAERLNPPEPPPPYQRKRPTRKAL